MSCEITVDTGGGVVAGSPLTTVGDAWGECVSRGDRLPTASSPAIINIESARLCAAVESTPVLDWRAGADRRRGRPPPIAFGGASTLGVDSMATDADDGRHFSGVYCRHDCPHLAMGSRRDPPRCDRYGDTALTLSWRRCVLCLEDTSDA